MLIIQIEHLKWHLRHRTLWTNPDNFWQSHLRLVYKPNYQICCGSDVKCAQDPSMPIWFICEVPDPLDRYFQKEKTGRVIRNSSSNHEPPLSACKIRINPGQIVRNIPNNHGPPLRAYKIRINTNFKSSNWKFYGKHDKLHKSGYYL